MTKFETAYSSSIILPYSAKREVITLRTFLITCQRERNEHVFLFTIALFHIHILVFHLNMVNTKQILPLECTQLMSQLPHASQPSKTPTVIIPRYPHHKPSSPAPSPSSYLPSLNYLSHQQQQVHTIMTQLPVLVPFNSQSRSGRVTDLKVSLSSTELSLINLAIVISSTSFTRVPRNEWSR